MYRGLIFFLLIFSPSIGKTQLTATDSLMLLLENSDNPQQQIRLLMDLADLYVYHYPDSALYFSNQALAINQIEALPENGFILARLGQALWSKGELEDAMTYLNEALNIGESNRDTLLFARVWNRIGTIHSALGEEELALFFYDKSLKAYEKLHLRDFQIGLNNNIARTYQKQLKLDSAKHYFLEALKMIGTQQHRFKPLLLHNYGETFHLEGNLDSATHYFVESLEAAKATKTLRPVIISKQALAQIALKRQQFEKALTLAKEAVELAEPTHSKELRFQTYLTYSNALQAVNDHKGALEYLEQYIQLRDSVQNEQLKSNLSQKSRKEQELKLSLAEQKAHLKTSESNFKSLVIFFLILLILFVGAIIAFLLIKQRSEKKAQSLIRESEARYRLLAENASDGVAAFDKHLQLTYGSPALQKRFGFDSIPEGMSLRDFMKFIHPEDVEKIKAATSNPDVIKKPVSKFQYRVLQNGQYIWVEDVVTRKFDHNGDIERFYINSRVVHDRVLAEAALRESTELLKSTQKIAGLGGWTWCSADQTFNFSGEVFAQLELPPPQKTVDFQFLKNHSNKAVYEVFDQVIKEVLENKRPFEIDFQISNGEQQKWFKIVGKLKSEPDKPIQVMGYLQNISDKKEMEAIKRFSRALELKNKEIEEFAYIASHDLQEPVRTISNFIQLLKRKLDRASEDEIQQYFAFIEDAAKRMSQLIKELLDYSRLGRSGKSTEIDFNTLIEAVKADLGSTIEKNSAQIISQNLPKIQAYPLEMRQLFQNLISNAIKFQPKDNKPVIKIAVEEQQHKYVFSVADNGIGIDPKYHHKIFNIFQRLHKREDYNGTGIGLAHCRKIVELHNGKIWLESEPDVGSTFYFSIKKKHFEPETKSHHAH